MTNTLYLPELREMIAERDEAGLREFCTALHPGRLAEYMEGLTSEEDWLVLSHADGPTRVEIFHYLEPEKQVTVIETFDRAEIARFIGDLASDDRVDLLKKVDPNVVLELMPLLAPAERRDILRLTSYPEGTAGAVMTTDFARVSEQWTIGQAMEHVATQASQLESVYCLYVVDAEDHLRGVVTARQWLTAMGKPEMQIAELMQRDLVAVKVNDDQEDVADVVARYNFVMIPVVDDQYRMLGIITHDDVMDVVQEEAIEDAQLIGAVSPLDDAYLATSVITLAWKRGIWLTVLFIAGLFTALSLSGYEQPRNAWPWLAIFIPLVISSGGNSGSQSATLIVTALAAGHVEVRDWMRIAWREILQGVLLGGFLAILGYGIAFYLLTDHFQTHAHADSPVVFISALVVPVTLVLVITAGTLIGAMLPLLFHRIGLDPAMMSTPFVAGLSDIIGIVIYMNVAMALLARH